MSEPIILIRAKNYKSPAMMNAYRTDFLRQSAEGLVLIPHDFEYAVINPDALKCEIKVEPIKKRTWWMKLLGIY